MYYDHSEAESTLDEAPFGLRDCFETSIARVAPQAHKKGLELAMLIYGDVPERVIGDAMRISQILVSLIHNSIKSTQSGEIIVRVMLEEEDDRECSLRVSITDTGTGILKPPGLPGICDPDIDAPFRASTGSDPGLATCHKLAEAMYGTLSMVNNEGGGSTSTLEFKLTKNNRHVVNRNGIDAKVLLYDTHSLSRLATYHRLCSQGIAADAVDEETALEAALRNRDKGYTALILGFTHKDIASGFMERLLKRLKKECALPVMALLSSSDRSKLDAAHAFGARAALSKPVSGDSLCRNLEAMLTAKGCSGKPPIHRPRPHLEPNSARSFQGFKILVADDNRISRQLIAELLSGTGAEVQLAENGEQTTAFTANYEFDLILMDLHMPEMDGLNATWRIHQGPPPGNRVPIIALTVDTDPMSMPGVLDSGMDGFLRKPVTKAQLWQTIQEVIEGIASATTFQAENVSYEATNTNGDEHPVRDMDEALNITGGDSQLAQQMFTAMLLELPIEYRRIQQLYTDKDWEALAETAHHLCGSVAYCGVPALEQSVRRVEDIARTADPKQIDTAILELETEIQRVTEST